MTFIPGQHTTVTINSDNFTTIGSVVSLSLGRNIIAKKHFGSDGTDRVAGKSDVTFSANGNISAELAADLYALHAALAPVAFSIQIGEAGQATDGGVFSGNALLTNLTMSVDADQDWAWSLEAAAHGTVTYTPASSS